jgi:hypothetical protein
MLTYGIHTWFDCGICTWLNCGIRTWLDCGICTWLDCGIRTWLHWLDCSICIWLDFDILIFVFYWCSYVTDWNFCILGIVNDRDLSERLFCWVWYSHMIGDCLIEILFRTWKCCFSLIVYVSSHFKGLAILSALNFPMNQLNSIRLIQGE